MELLEVIQLLLRKKLLLAIIPVVTAMLAFAVRFSSDRSYISESQISTGLTLANDLTGEKRNLSPFEITINFGNIRENMSSKLVVNRLAYKLLYRDLSSDRPFRKPKFGEGEIQQPKGKELDKVLEELNNAIDNYQLISRSDSTGIYIYQLLDKFRYSEQELLTNVKIFRVGNTDFINVLYACEVPKLSAFVVNLWADNFVEYYNHQKLSYLNESLDVLTHILKEKQAQLDQSTEKLNRYKTRYVYRSSEMESDPMGEYERLIRDKEGSLRSLNIRLQDIREKIANTDQSSSFKSRQKIIGLKNDIDRLSTIQLSRPDDKAIADSIEFLRRDLQSQMYLHTSTSSDKNNLDNLFAQENELKVNYQIALADLQKLKSQYQQERGMAQDLAANKSILDNLKTEVQQARDEFIAAQDKYNQAKSELISGASAVKLSYYGDVPEDPQSRKTIVFTAAGFMGGLMITIVVIIGMEFMDQRLKNVYKFKRATNLEPDAIIPLFPQGQDDLRLTIQGGHISMDQHSEINFLQTIRNLRYKILTQDGCKIILFTSFRPNAGKSFLLLSIANAFSMINKKVLIFDTNFRNSFITQNLMSESHDEKQFHDLRQGKINIEEVERCITSTENPNIFLLGGAIINSTPQEVFSKIDLRSLFDRLRKTYDYIFIEGACLNTYSDSRELFQYADKAISIFSAKDEFNAKDEKSKGFLQENSEQVLINILNKVDSQNV